MFYPGGKKTRFTPVDLALILCLIGIVALLVYLAVESERPHRRESLVGLLWPDYAERSARANLRHSLANLRSASVEN